MQKKIGRYSKYLRPLTILFDVSVINLLFYFLVVDETLFLYQFLTITVAWLISSLITSFYDIYRFTKIIQIVDKSIKQFFLFTVFIFAFIGFFSRSVSNTELITYLICCFFVVVLTKYSVFNALKIFRKYFKGNQRRVVVVGSDKFSNQLTAFFENEKDYGYNLIKQFHKEIPGEEIVQFCNDHSIDEIYLSLEYSKTRLSLFVDYVDNNFKTLKFIPNKKEKLAAAKAVHYYGLIPVMPARKFPLQNPLNQIIKRLFDIVFSSLVIIFVLSWLVPLIALLIKIESRGPIFFNQVRNGLYYKEFKCFKFRSMYVNDDANTIQATKNDKRITNVGRFLRKSSLDEMPQFFNVFLGDMSVCGPRPHMVSMTNKYERVVNRYKLRHYIKPGITGMAQTHGCRGEIENDYDIVNRVKYDIFYLENWSLLLDVKIIYLTVKNAILGDKKAY